MYVATSCTLLSGLSVVCGCIHGCTLSVLGDMLVANAERKFAYNRLIVKCNAKLKSHWICGVYSLLQRYPLAYFHSTCTYNMHFLKGILIFS